MRTIPFATATFIMFASNAMAADPYWLAPMKEVHAGSSGTKGYIAQFGDSITYSMAFWSPIGWDEPDR